MLFYYFYFSFCLFIKFILNIERVARKVPGLIFVKKCLFFGFSPGARVSLDMVDFGHFGALRGVHFGPWGHRRTGYSRPNDPILREAPGEGPPGPISGLGGPRRGPCPFPSFRIPIWFFAFFKAHMLCFVSLILIDFTIIILLMLDSFNNYFVFYL